MGIDSTAVQLEKQWATGQGFHQLPGKGTLVEANEPNPLGTVTAVTTLPPLPQAKEQSGMCVWGAGRGVGVIFGTGLKA